MVGAVLLASMALTCGEEDTAYRIDDYLLDEPYTRLVIEVDAMEGRVLPEQVETLLVQVTQELVDKPDGVEMIYDTTLASTGHDREWDADAMDEGARRHFDLEVDGHTTKIHLLLLDGHRHKGGEAILGSAWDHRYIALFMDGIKDACTQGNGGGSLTSQSCMSVQLGVTVHEIGHVLGLVNNGLNMVQPHEDLEHPRHDPNPDCVMYWAYERRAVVNKIDEALEAGESPEEIVGFCPDSLADLEARRSGTGD